MEVRIEFHVAGEL